MNGTLVYLVAFILLITLAYMTKRRIGAPILGLAAGAILSEMWSSGLSGWLLGRGLEADGVMLTGLVGVALVVTPAAILSLHGHLHKTAVSRILSAALFTVVAIAFLHKPLQTIVVSDEVTVAVGQFMGQYGEIIIALGILVAIVDLFLTRLHKPAVKKGKH